MSRKNEPTNLNHFTLSLGSNIFPQTDFLTKALFALSEFSQIRSVSPIFENPPLLPPNAPAEWFQFFFNTVVEVSSPLTPEEFLQKTQAIETQLGRPTNHEKWSPRVIDIDLLDVHTSQGRKEIKTPQLTLPHPELPHRNFVLSPLAYLDNNWLASHRQHPQPLSLFVTIFNVTPDSFSDVPSTPEEKLKSFQKLLKQHPAIVDLGAESTRPGAHPVTVEEEWHRLQPFFEYWRANSAHYPFTKLCIDTRHALTARRALDYGASLLNDVSGLTDAAMVDVAHGFEKVIFMHSLTLPADPKMVLTTPPVETLLAWAEQRREEMPQLSEKLIFDPGLGFGKTPLQSLQILQNIESFHSLDLPLLIGHSRKSLLNLWSTAPFAERDPETLGLSSQLFGQVEYLRIHNLEAHQRQMRSLLAVRGPSL